MYLTTPGVATFATFPTPQPSAYITVNRGRIKAYGQTVYLKAESTFEIELWNPKTTPVLAKIWINGQLISEAGLIIRPGQRVYLDRFIDVAQKLKFSTYEVEDSTDAKLATRNNGKIDVIFYDESPKQYFRRNQGKKLSKIVGSSSSNNWDYNLGSGPLYSSPSSFNISSSGSTAYFSNTPGIGGSVNTTISNGSLGFSTLTSTTIDTAVNANPTTVETGRIEAGEKSNQSFYESSGEFSLHACAQSNWQILPDSQKPAEISQIRSYCTTCGTKQKPNWKFCPTCGKSVTE